MMQHYALPRIILQLIMIVVAVWCAGHRNLQSNVRRLLLLMLHASDFAGTLRRMHACKCWYSHFPLL